jgi:hypothetical protein
MHTREFKATYTIRQTAEHLGTPVSSTYLAARKGKIPTLDIGGTLRVPGWWLERTLNPPEAAA